MRYQKQKAYLLSVLEKKTGDITVFVSMLFAGIFYYIFHGVLIVEELSIVLAFLLLFKSIYEILVHKEYNNLILIMLVIWLIYLNLN